MEIKLKPHILVIDDKDYEFFRQYSWHLNKAGNGYYVMTSINGKTKYLHRLLLNAQKGLEVDHINHNPLDNRRENLRLCTSSQNKFNKPKKRDNTSGYKGVTFDRNRGKWKAHVWVNGVNHNVGRFATALEASTAYNETAKRLHGEFYFAD